MEHVDTEAVCSDMLLSLRMSQVPSDAKCWYLRADSKRLCEGNIFSKKSPAQPAIPPASLALSSNFPATAVRQAVDRLSV